MKVLFEQDIELFPTTYDAIIERIRNTNPIKYGKTRNFVDGAVSYLSPYISRGVISTQQVLSELLNLGYQPLTIKKFIQELAWRDYWQQVWIVKGETINSDLKHKQTPISNVEIPEALVKASTGITAIDTAIKTFYNTGYLHNHLRMYIAAIACNIAQSHWKVPAQWMYYHLLDADWASNALSWQWVAGSNSHKKYYANQENINTYCYTQQKHTFLDISYEAFAKQSIPKILKETCIPELKTPLPTAQPLTINKHLPTLLYNFYNLDPNWKQDMDANRILLLEPSHFKTYPISQKTMDFVLALSKNIKNIQIYVGAFQSLSKTYALKHIHFKEHPLNAHYKGIETPRDWIFPIKGYYPSFFKFWKQCEKEWPF